MAPKAGTDSKMNSKANSRIRGSLSTSNSNTKKPKIRVPASTHRITQGEPAVDDAPTLPTKETRDKPVQPEQPRPMNQKARGESISRIKAGKVNLPTTSHRIFADLISGSKAGKGRGTTSSQAKCSTSSS